MDVLEQLASQVMSRYIGDELSFCETGRLSVEKLDGLSGDLFEFFVGFKLLEHWQESDRQLL